LHFLKRFHIGHIAGNPPQENVSKEFIKILFQILGYEKPGTHIATTDEPVNLFVGKCVELNIGVAVMDVISSLVFLIVEQSHTDRSQGDAESRLLAQAIAIVQHHQQLSELVGLPKRKITVCISVLH
jgi:hypothetical protein